MQAVAGLPTHPTRLMELERVHGSNRAIPNTEIDHRFSAFPNEKSLHLQTTPTHRDCKTSRLGLRCGHVERLMKHRFLSGPAREVTHHEPRRHSHLRRCPRLRLTRGRIILMSEISRSELKLHSRVV